MNVFADDWDDPFPTPEGWRSHYKRLGIGKLGVGLYELLPGQTQCAYHFHHGNDEALIVLSGRPTLRTPGGERELQAGDVAQFPAGPEGAHQMVNRSDEPARYVIAAVHTYPVEIVEHLDSGKVLAMAKTEDRPLWSIHRFDDEVDYMLGEEARA
jgi:uncharacterized cupin superfamily protein